MTRLAHWSFTHRRIVIAGWLLAAIVIAGLGSASGSRFNTNFNLPGSDSQAALNVLTKNFPAASGEGDQVVIQARRGSTIRSVPVQTAVTGALARVAKVPGVQAVGSPYSQSGAAQITRDGTVAFATVTWKDVAAKVTKADARNLIEAAESADGANVHVSLGGQAISNEAGAGPGLSVIVGVIAALIILLIVLGGAILASLIPLLTTALALVIGTSAISLLSHAMDVASVATDLAVLIGLGVGVDYGLFIISRHRSGVQAGLSYEDAAARAVNTSGRTVLFAGSTVCIALLGQFALGVRFLYGLSLASAIAVALTMATALTFLPAMLGFLGPRVLSRRERAALAVLGAASGEAAGFWFRWAKFIGARKRYVIVGALALVLIIALPISQLRLGSSDASTAPSGNITHQAYAALSQGFGPGFNGPLELAGSVASKPDIARFEHLLTAASRTHGVAAVTPPVISPNGKVILATLYPTTGPQAAPTVTLVKDLRHNLIPQNETGTDLAVHVGGQTAAAVDFSHVLTNKLPVFIAVVVFLAFLLLTAVFRSLLIPLVASIMNLLSVAAALGALNAVFNLGWGASLIGLTVNSPIDAFIPVLLFSVLFGLSTDYEIYLVSRIQEEWQTPAQENDHQQNHQAITNGQAKSSRIIAGAASIMILVFGSFLLTGNRILQEFGFGLGFAVLIDALIIRSLLVPAIMHAIGPANWAIPAWLDRIVPNLSIEAGDDPASPTKPDEPETTPLTCDRAGRAGIPEVGSTAKLLDGHRSLANANREP